MDISYWIAVVLVAIPLLLLVLMLLAPFWYKPFIQDVNKPNKAYLFTIVEHGRVKVIMLGSRPLRYLMNNPGYVIQRSVPRDWDAPEKYTEGGRSAKKFQVVKDKKDIIADGNKANQVGYTGNIALDWWRWYLYKTCGVILVLRPWQHIKVYAIQKDRFERDEKGAIKHVTVGDNEKSDHLRVQLFQWPFHATQIETAAKLPLSVGGILEAVSVNPDINFWGVQSWSDSLNKTTLTRVREVFRALTPDEVLGGIKIDEESGEVSSILELSDEAVYKIGDQILEINHNIQGRGTGTVENFGIYIRFAQVPITNIDLTLEERREFMAYYLEHQKALGREAEGHGEAKAQKAIIDVVSEDSAVGIPVLAAQAQIQTAGKSKTTFITGPGDSSSAILPGILQELTRANERSAANDDGGEK